MKKSTNSPKQEHQKHHYESEPQSFKEEFSHLNQDLQALLQHVKKSGSTLAKDAGHDVLERAEKLASRMEELNNKISGPAVDFLKQKMARTKEKAQEYTTDIEGTITEHPLSSVAISFGIGLVLAKALGSWHSSH